MKKVVLYTRNNCPHCEVAKKYLDKENITYRLCNVQTPAGQKEFHRLGYRGVPVLKVANDFLQGFTIKGFLNLYKS